MLAGRLGLDTRVTCLGHIQRGGRPCAYDRIMPTLQGVEAVNALLQATPDTPSYMIGVRENKITRVPLMEAVAMVNLQVCCSSHDVKLTSSSQTHSVTEAIEAKDFEKAMSLRDPEFEEALDGFFATSVYQPEPRLPHHQRMRIAIMQYVLSSRSLSILAI